MPSHAVHASPLSGTWYPDSPVAIEALLAKLWAKSEERTGAFVLPGGRAFLAPHAGLSYSGTVAAAVYRHLERQQPRCVIIAGFTHRGAPDGISIPDVEAYQTPLGRVPVDLELADELSSVAPFRRLPESRLCDHSVEIQLPMLHKALPRATVVPLYVGRLDREQREQAADLLARCMAPEVVLVASSDLTHFGRDFGFEPFPVDRAVSERLRRLDFQVLESSGSLREEVFLETLRETSATVCGGEPIALMLATLRRIESGGEIFQEVLDYQTSGEITGDFHHSVSYGSLGFFPYPSFELDEPAQNAVLNLARRTLAEYQQTGKQAVPEFSSSGLAALARRAPLFVTLHQRGELRGCLGRITTDAPLEKLVPELTLAAALEDSRFDPVSPSEEGITVEISVLSPMKRITQAGDFQIHEHGAMLKAKGRQGLLLPQVSIEQNWNAEQFLQALGTKAGAGGGAHLDPSAKISVFRAQVIH
jgi:AmmeMemoRadiSam system protein B/AmmeMemoRadiSam system protein A